MTAYAQTIDVNLSPSVLTFCGDLVIYAYSQTLDINLSPNIPTTDAVLLTGLHAKTLDINLSPVVGSIAADLVFGGHDETLDINLSPNVPSVAGELMIGVHSKLLDVDLSPTVPPIAGVLIAAELYLAIEARHTTSFIRTPLKYVPDSGAVKATNSGIDFRIYIYAPNYSGWAVEHATVRYNFDDKRFVRGIYASKAPTE